MFEAISKKLINDERCTRRIVPNMVISYVSIWNAVNEIGTSSSRPQFVIYWHKDTT